MKSEPQPPNLLFRLAALLTAAFVVTILALVATILGDPAAPVAKFLEREGGRLLLAEVVGILITGIGAMAWDRRRTLRESPPPDCTASDDEPSGATHFNPESAKGTR
jgi:hypothetical protein